MKKKTKKKILYYCNGKKCCRYNAESIEKAKNITQKNNLEKKVKIEEMKCQGMCKLAPIFYLKSEDKYIKETSAKKVEQLFNKYIL